MSKRLIETELDDTERCVIRFEDYGFQEGIELGRYNYARSRRPLTPHSHDDCMEICYLEKGKQVYETGGEIFSLKGGDIFLTFPGEVHSTANAPEEKGRLYWLIFEIPPLKIQGFDIRAHNSACKEISREAKKIHPSDSDFRGPAFRSPETYPPFLSGDRKTLEQLRTDLLGLPRRSFRASEALAGHFSRLMELGAEDLPYTRMRMENEMRELLIDLVECSQQHESDLIHPGIRRVLKALEEDIARDWSNAALAEVARLSEPHFKVIFKKATGVPPADYLARIRIDAAKQLLKTEGLSMTDIAFECGFSSSQYFATVFKRYAGQTPSLYRSSTQRPPG